MMSTAASFLSGFILERQNPLFSKALRFRTLGALFISFQRAIAERADLRSSAKLSLKLSLLFRRLRGRELLEARIIPQSIEHWIESKERWS